MQTALPRTPSRTKRKSRGLHGVREAARQDSKLKFTALLHHVNEDCLTEAFFNLKKSAAVGVDGVTWHDYEQNLEANIADLHGRIHRGAYRASAFSSRVDSQARWSTATFGRGCPGGQDCPTGGALGSAKYLRARLSRFQLWLPPWSQTSRCTRCIERCDRRARKVNWILDADVEGYFDSIDHSWLVEFLEHRIGDRRILRLIRKWLCAGVIEDGNWSETVQGLAAGFGDFTVTQQRVPSLCVRPLDRMVAAKSLPPRCSCCAIRG